jgi:chromate transporter
MDLTHVRLRWIDERAYADLIALCQFLPGALAAFYNPVWTSATVSPGDFGLALAAFVLLVFWHTPPWLVVILTAAGGWVLQTVL